MTDKKDHPAQAIDTKVPSEDKVDEKAFKALQDAYEGDPEDEDEDNNESSEEDS